MRLGWGPFTMRAPNTDLTAEYHFVRDQVASHWAASHARLLDLFGAVVNAGAVSRFEKHKRLDTLPQFDGDKELLNECRAFAMRRHVRLRLGSGGSPYGWFPPQLLIIRAGGRMEAVLPCQIEGKIVEPEEFLEAVLRGDAWSVVSARQRADKGPRRRLIDLIVANPTCLEPGLKLAGQNAWVADDAGETGYIDLVFIDAAGRYLLVEVKVNQGIGQLLKQCIMFERQNFLDENRVRPALACPDIPPVRRAACARAGGDCFEIPPGSITEA